MAVEMGRRTKWRALVAGVLALTSFTAARAAASADDATTAVAAQDPRHVAMGLQFVCAITTAQLVQCAGTGSALGQRGDGTTVGDPGPTTVSGVTDARSISAGLTHACVLRGDATVACWGDNDHGQLGNGDLAVTQSATPITVPALSGVRGIAAATDATCALLADGTVSCWGFRLHDYAVDHLAPGDTATPETVAGVADVVEIVAGQMHFCARRSDGRVLCWGNDLGLDPGTPGLGAQRPFLLSNLTGVAALFAGGDVVCAVDGSGDATCGGLLSSASTPQPPDLGALHNVADISASTTHLCVTDAAGTLQCWGDNVFASMGGLGTDSVSPIVPREVDEVVESVSGFLTSCALTRLRELWCWGASATVSTDDDESHPAPVRRPLGTVVAIAK